MVKLPKNWVCTHKNAIIPHKDGLEALKKTLEEENVNKSKATTILDFSKLVLTSNYFKFLGQSYLQKSGTAMGTKMAPSYANIFMGQFEKKMLASFPHKPLVYFRYIDDIFMIWTEGEDTLNKFLNHCNSLNPSIQFEQTVSNTNIPFLDVNIIFENWRLKTDLYSKPTDKHQYLYYSSCYPKHTKTSLPYSLALRLWRICSNETLFQKRIEQGGWEQYPTMHRTKSYYHGFFKYGAISKSHLCEADVCSMCS